MRMIKKEEISLIVDCNNNVVQALKAIQNAKKSLDLIGKKNLEEIDAIDLKKTIDGIESQIGLAKIKVERLLK